MRQSEPPVLKPEMPIGPVPAEPEVIAAAITKVRAVVKPAAVAATSVGSKHAR